MLEQINKIEEEIMCGNFSHRPKSNVRSSIVWTAYHEILDKDGAIIRNFFYCTKCHAVTHQSTRGTTTQLLRHPCVRDLMPNAPSDHIQIDQIDFDNLKTAAAKFVCLDLRPFYSVECPGFQEVVMAAVRLGQKYPQLNKDDLIKNFPGRKAVENEVYKEALDSKDHMKCLLREAINYGGLGCTLDLWTDKYKHNTWRSLQIFALSKTHTLNQNALYFTWAI